MSANGSNGFLNIEDANLRVRSGNVYAKGITVGGITVGASHGLQSVSDVSNTTSNTLQFTNATTSFKATSNIEVGGDVSYTSKPKISVESNVVTEYTGPHDRPLRKYPEVAIINGTLGPTGGIVQTPGVSESQKGYTVTSSSSWGNGGTDTRAGWCAFDEGKSTTTYKIWQSGNYYTTATPGLYNRSPAQSHTADGVNYEGEWIKLELPRKINISAIEINATAYSSLTGHVGGRPYEGAILGSNDDSTWSLLKSFSGGLSWATTTVAEGGGRVTLTPDTNTTNKYRYIMLIVNKIQGSRSSVDINEIKYYGHEEGDASLDTTLKSVYNVPATTGTQLEVYYDGQDYTQASDFAGSGGVVDKAGGDQNGTVNGNVGFDSTYKAFTFNGNASNYINAGAVGLTDDAVHTVSLWFKYTSNGTHQAIFSISSNGADESLLNTTNFLLRDDGTMWFVHWGNDAKIPYIFIEEHWYHVTYTYVGGGTSLANRGVYINGKRVYNFSSDSTGNGDELTLTSPQMIIGKRYWAADQLPLNGSIANFRLYSKALNADQVKELYDYQKDYFLGSKSQVTLYKGHLGVGVTEPSGQLELAGDERIQEYPPRGMTDFDTYIEGHGVFKASASSQYSDAFEPWGAFSDTSDYDLDIWVSGNDEWYTSNGYPSVLHYLSDNTPGGAWIKIEMPYKIKLNSFSFVTGTRNYSTETFPENFQIWASNNGTEWNHIYSVSGFGNPPNETGGTGWGHTNVNSQTYYSMYAMVITKVYMVGNFTRFFVSIPRWKLFGTPGPTTLDKGSLSLTRSLDVPRVSRYDVDTETPRPEKLVLDFDTTVNSSPTDISGKGNHGAFNGGASYSPADKAFVFDGTDDHIRATVQVTPDFAHSVSVWIKVDTVGDNTFFSLGNETTVGTDLTLKSSTVYTTASGFSFVFYGGDMTIPFSYSAGRWYHIVATRETGGTFPNTQKFYIDGVDYSGSASWNNPSSTTLALPTTATLLIGKILWATSARFDGQISNFKLYNVALEASEVRKLYNLGRTGRSMVISDTAVGIGKVPEAQLDVRGTANFVGDVGIGTTSPGKMLDVNGTTRSRKSAGWKSGTFDSTGVNMGPMADGTTDGPQIGWEFHVTFSAATAGSRVEIYGAYKHSGPLYAASEKWTFRFKEGVGTPDYSNYAELVNDAEPLADTYYAVIRVVNSIYNNTNVVAARHHFMSHSVGCHQGIGATIWQAQGYIDMGGESSDDRFNYLRITSSSGNIKGQWTAFPITT